MSFSSMKQSTINISTLPSEIINIVQGKAFIYPYAIDAQEVLGNPASIVFCNKQFPSKETMSKIAIEENTPMTAFVLHKQNNIFDIEFYTPSGDTFSLCGHATIIASHFISEQYSFEEVIFLREGLPYQLSTTNIKANNTHQFTLVTMPAFMPKSLAIHDASVYTNCLGIANNQVEAIYQCEELQDIIVVVSNAEILRNVEPIFPQLSTVLANNNIRGLFITALSSLPEIDYEVRIFAPHFDIDEDISCGSANCSLLPLWNKLLNAPNNKEFKILCPYNFSTNKMGGIEIGHFNAENNTINIGGMIGK